jgi:hypothetical protein
MSDSPREAGVQALKSGDAQAAVEHLTLAVQQNPQDGTAYGYLGAAYGQLNVLDKAVESLKKATQLIPTSAPLRFNLATALEQAGTRDEAVAEYRRALALDPKYDRARQALARLGEAETAQAPKPASPWSGAPPPAAAPAAPAGGMGDFIIGVSEPAPAAAAAPPPPAYGPPGSAGPPGAYPAPGGYAPPPAPGPLNPAATVADAGPAPWSAPPPTGLQPLGDWTPPAQDDNSPWQPAPPRPPQVVHDAPTGTIIATAENPGRSMDRGLQTGHCYLSGLGMGAWWGLIGAIIVFLTGMATINVGDLPKASPILAALCLMTLALGVLIYGVIGLIVSKSDDAESLGANLGLVVGILTAIPVGVIFVPLLGIMGGVFPFGAIWASRQMGKSLGGNINEMQQSIFVVAGPGKVAITPTR